MRYTQTDEALIEVVIYAMNGAVVQRETTANFSIKKLASGIYYIQLAFNGGVSQSKFVKE